MQLKNETPSNSNHLASFLLPDMYYHVRSILNAAIKDIFCYERVTCLCTFLCFLTILPYQTQSAYLPRRRLYQHLHWNLIFHLRLWVQILSLSSPSKEAVAQRLTGHQSASGRCWMLAFASLGFFPQFFLDSSVFILTHEFFSLFLFQFSPASHYGGEQVTGGCLVAGQCQHITYEEKVWLFFQKFPWYDPIRNPAPSTIWWQLCNSSCRKTSHNLT